MPVSQLAKVVPALEPGIEWRRDRLPTITVRATVPDDVQPNDVAMALYAKMQPLRDQLPPGYSIAIQGGAEESAESQASIAAKAPVMLFVIMVLLMVQLRHFGKSLLVFFTGPLGLIGAAAALLTTNSPFGFVAILGVIALLGIIMRNSVILIDQIDQDRASGVDPLEAMVGAAVRRFRPIMLTAAAAVLALIPIRAVAFLGTARLRHDGWHHGRDGADDPGPAGCLCAVLPGRPGCARDGACCVLARRACSASGGNAAERGHCLIDVARAVSISADVLSYPWAAGPCRSPAGPAQREVA